MTADRQDSLTITDIARLSGVRPSAVSNWRNRWPDFPVAEDGRFLRNEIEAWLKQHGREVHNPDASDPWAGIWKAADSMRSVAAVEDVFELLLQLIALRAASDHGRGRGRWLQLTQDPDRPIGGTLEQFASEVAREDVGLGAALEPSSSSRRIPASTARHLIGAIEAMPRDTNWGWFATGLTSDFPERFGLRGAESFTPEGLAEVLIGLAEPIRGRIYDPACGAGTLLARARQRSERRDLELYGQDINAQAQRFARLILSLVEAPSDLALGDTLLDDRLPDLRADRVIAQPPLNQRMTFAESLRYDPRWVWGIPSSFADWLWVQHVAHHLAPDGIGVIAMAPGPLFRGGSDAAIRRALLDSDMLDAVIQLPPAMLPATTVSLTVMVLQRGRANRTGRVLFVDAGKAGARERGGLTRLAPTELAEVLDALRTWRRGGDPSREGAAGIATAQELLQNDANLLPSRYVGAAAPAGEPIVAQFQRLKTTVDERLTSLPDVLQILRAELADIEVAE